MITDQQLLRFDAAAGISDDLGRSPHALATLVRITSTAPEGSQTPARPIRRRWRRYSFAAVAAAGVLVAPVLGTGAAYASWSAVPRPATAREAAALGKNCLISATVEGETSHDYKVRLIEIRGVWSYTILDAPDGFAARCVFSSEPVTQHSAGYAPSYKPNLTMTGPLRGTPAADGLVTDGVLDVDPNQGSTTTGNEQGHQMTVDGKVGSNVRNVSFLIDGTDVDATVKDGWFAAWWPQRVGNSLAKRAIDDLLDNDGPPNPKVVITLIDGTTRVAHIGDYDTSPM
jgi:hypothetical protein